LRRKVRGRVQLTNGDRWFFVQLYRWFPSVLQVLITDVWPRVALPIEGCVIDAAE
jgi:hypothetical protein